MGRFCEKVLGVGFLSADYSGAWDDPSVRLTR